MANPAALSSQMPPADDYLSRRQRDLERSQMEQAAARTLAASQIGNGGTLQIDGSLVVSGTLSVPAGALNTASSISAGTTITAGTGITATSGNITAASGDVTASSSLNGGALSVSGGGYVGGQIVSPGTRGAISSGNTLYIAADGTIGLPTSSERYKQDITDADIDVQAVDALRLVSFKYRNDVDDLGDDAPTVLGLIAEEVDALGLTELVRYEGGVVESVNYDRLPLFLLKLVQSQSERIAVLEKKLGKLK